ncbi:MAG: hypothetical protein ACRC35_00460 [Angustibacter sp.]
MLTRPFLLPGLHRVWRDPTTLQVGLSPQRGTVVTGLRSGDDAVVAALDGTHTIDQLETLARSHGLPPDRARRLVHLLSEAGVVTDAAPAGPGQPTRADRADLARLGPQRATRLRSDAQTWAQVYPGVADGIRLLAHRTERHVQLDGRGALTDLVAQTLVAAGVGRVTAVDSPRGAHSRSRADRFDLVVVVRDDLIDLELADQLDRARLPHLAVVCAGDRVVVGPLVAPDRGPCLRCLDLHRRDRDPGWPRVAVQVSLQRAQAPQRGEVASSTAAAGLIGLQVLAWLDGKAPPVTQGRTIDVTLPQGLLETRRWRTHPQCGCTGRAFQRRPGDDQPSVAAGHNHASRVDDGQ